MSQYTFKTNIDTKEFDYFVSHHELGNMMQKSAWGKLKKDWNYELCGLYKDNEMVGSAMILFRPLPLNYTFAYIPRGPIMNYQNKEEVTFFMNEIKKYTKNKKAIFVKFDPMIVVREYRREDSFENKNIDIIMTNLKAIGAKHYGFTKDLNATTQPRYMAAVKKDAIDKLPRDTEKKIRRAYKHHVKGIICGVDRIDDFSKIIAYTEKRQNVTLRSEEYFKDMMECFKEDAFLLLCEVNLKELLLEEKNRQEELLSEKQNTPENAKKKIKRLDLELNNLERDLIKHNDLKEKYGDNALIAGQLAVKSNNMLEMLYSGLNEDFAKFYPNYLSYIETFKYAFDCGCEYSNMGGIPMDRENGLAKFKFNFDPYVIEYIGEFDLVNRSFMYKMVTFLLKKRKEAMVKKETMNQN